VYSSTIEPMTATVDSPGVEAPASVVPRPDGPGEVGFDALYTQYVDFVWRSLWRLGVPDGGLEDAVQDVFVVVLRRLADFEGRSAVTTWLFGIAIRVARDHRRASRRRGPLDPIDERLADAGADPRTQTERSEALRVLSMLLDQLDDEKRALFVMSEIEEMTVAQMAEALGANPNTVYSRLRVAREAFDRAVLRYRRRGR
jgi:RNA polymerase sigma-70 factor (ECF subfamily)